MAHVPQLVHVLVDNQTSLADLLVRLEGVDRVALDTEADSLHHYFEKVCLIQLSIPDAHFLVDPLAEIDLGSLMDRLRKVTLILHGADYDLRMLLSDYGFRPGAPVVDTMIASRLLGEMRPGLAQMVEQFFGVALSKKAQKADWARRPLSPALQRYARDDTRFLLELADRLLADLRARGRAGWLEESCQRLVEATGQERNRDPEDAWRIRGSGKLPPDQLVLLREIWFWRDAEARRIDRPPFRILHNQELIDLVVWLSKDPKRSPGRSPGIGRTVSGRRLTALERTADKARKIPRASWPTRRRGVRPPPRGTLFRPVRQACIQAADDLGIESAVLAPKAAIDAIARDLPGCVEDLCACSGLMRWQAEVIEPIIRPILDGVR